MEVTNMDEQQDDKTQNDQVTLEQLQADLDSAMQGWKRAAADFENYKRRKEGESKELVEFAREVTVAKLLPTIDSLEQALRHLPEYHPHLASPLKGEETAADVSSAVPSPGLPAEASAKEGGGGSGRSENGFEKQYQNWQTGVNGIIIQLDKVLGELGVKKIEALGRKFDPHFHEAVREVESESDDGMVIEELQTGFELNGKVIRASQVVISKKKEA